MQEKVGVLEAGNGDQEKGLARWACDFSNMVLLVKFHAACVEMSKFHARWASFMLHGT